MSKRSHRATDQLAEYVDGLPNISRSGSLIDERHGAAGGACVLECGAGGPFAGVDSAYAIALRTHQPLIAAGGKNLRSARLISILQYMGEDRDIGANRNAPATTGRAPSAGGSWGSDSAGAGDWDRRSGERRGR